MPMSRALEIRRNHGSFQRKVFQQEVAYSLFVRLMIASVSAALAALEPDMLIRELFLPDFDHEIETTRKIFNSLPETLPKDYRPHPKSMSMAYLVGHLAQLPGWAKMTMETPGLDLDPKAFKPFVPATRAEALAEFEKTVKETRPVLTASDDAAYQAPWEFKVMGQHQFTMPKWSVLRSFVLHHIVHHRAQLGVYLRLQDHAVPGSYGPSADDAGVKVSTK